MQSHSSDHPELWKSALELNHNIPSPYRHTPEIQPCQCQGNTLPSSSPQPGLTLLVAVQIDDLLQANSHGIVPVHAGTERGSPEVLGCTRLCFSSQQLPSSCPDTKGSYGKAEAPQGQPE